MKKCFVCNGKINSSGAHLLSRKTCSLECRNKLFRTSLLGKNNPNYRNSGIKNCTRCGGEYKSYNKKSKYCSHACADVSNRIDPSMTLREKKKITSEKYKYIKVSLKKYFCPVCIVREINRKNKRCKYCRKIKSKTITRCKTCSSEIFCYKIRLRSFCCEKCKFIYYKGQGNPNYIDGRTPENHIIRNSPEYKQWRKLVFERDKYTCVFCGKIGGELHADHIKPFSKYPELRLELSNGRTLCRPCHEKTPTYRRG
jgi:hypothetical protein